MFGKFSASFLAVLTISGVAYGQETTSQGNSTNFILIDYGISLSADGDVNDTAIHSVTSPIRVANDGEIVDDTSGFVGIGIGHRYANNIGAILRYETGELESGTLNIEVFPNNDEEITSANLASGFTTEVDSFFLEGVYFMPYSEQVELWGLVGVGQSEVTTSTASVIFNGGTDAVLAICSSSEDNTATRFGVGATYYLSQTQGFYGGVTISNYGDASYNSESNGECTNNPDTMTIDDIEATDLRIGYFRSF